MSDALHPDPETPTPIEEVYALTLAQRERRVKRLIDLAWESFHAAVDDTKAHGKGVHSVCVLFSGGKDSATVASLFRSVITHIVHADTGTGIQATRDFVAQTADRWGLPLIMEPTSDDYFELVRGNVRTKSGERVWSGGFPGAGAHAVLYQRLKERSLDKARHTLGVAGSRKEQSIWIAGRRRAESKARATVPHMEDDGSVKWCSPIVVWHKADLMMLRKMWGKEIPVNPTAVTLGMSGECGCLCNAAPGERDRWFAEFPNEPFLLEVLEVEAEIADRDDIPELRKKWGWNGHRVDKENPRGEGGRLCGPDCGTDPLLDLMDPFHNHTRRITA